MSNKFESFDLGQGAENQNNPNQNPEEQKLVTKDVEEIQQQLEELKNEIKADEKAYNKGEVSEKELMAKEEKIKELEDELKEHADKSKRLVATEKIEEDLKRLKNEIKADEKAYNRGEISEKELMAKEEKIRELEDELKELGDKIRGKGGERIKEKERREEIKDNPEEKSEDELKEVAQSPEDQDNVDSPEEFNLEIDDSPPEEALLDDNKVQFVENKQEEIIENESEEPKIYDELIIEPEFNLNEEELKDSLENDPKKAKEILSVSFGKSSSINRFFNKIELAYQKFWANINEKKKVKSKIQLDKIDMKLDILGDSKSEMIKTIELLKTQKIPGSESLELKIKEIDKQINTLSQERNEAYAKVTKRQRQVEIYTDLRDLSLERVLESYQEKIKPLEDELNFLENKKNELDLFIAVTEAEHNNRIIKLKEVEKSRNILIQNMISMGISNKKIDKDSIIVALNESLKTSYDTLKEEAQHLQEKRINLNKEVARVEKKAAPYKIKYNKYLRIKEGRPIEIEIEDKFISGESIMRSRVVNNIESTKLKESEVNRVGIFEFLNEWNNFIKNNYKTESDKSLIINREDLATNIRYNLKVNFDDFKNIITQYLKLKKVNLTNENFNKKIKVFENSDNNLLK